MSAYAAVFISFMIPFLPQLQQLQAEEQISMLPSPSMLGPGVWVDVSVEYLSCLPL
jgi:hypothetical protein